MLIQHKLLVFVFFIGKPALNLSIDFNNPFNCPTKF